MRKTVAVVVAVLVLAAVAVLVIVTRRARPEGAGYAASVPERSCVYLSFRNPGQVRGKCPVFGLVDELRQLGLGNQVRAVLEAAKESERKPEEIEKVLGTWDLLRRTLTGLSSMGVLGDEVALAIFDNGTGELPSVVVAARLRPKMADRMVETVNEALGKAAAASGGRIDEWEEEGIPGRSLMMEKSHELVKGLSPSFAFPPGEVFFSTSRQGVKEFINCGKGTGAVLAHAERFRKVVRHLPAAGQGLHYIDLGRIVSLAREFLSGTGREVLEKNPRPELHVKPDALVHYVNGYLSLAGALSAVGVRTSCLPGGVRHDAYFLLDEQALKGELAPLLGVKPAQLKSQRFVPRRAVNYSAALGMNAAAGGLYGWVRELLSSEPVYGREAVEKWELAQTEARFSLEKDVLPWVGSEFAVAMLGAPAMGSMGRFAYLIEVTDETRARMALETLARLVVEKRSPDVEFDTESYNGVDITKVGLPGPLRILGPCYAVTDGFLIAASDKSTLEEMVDCSRGKGETIRTSEKFVRLSGYLSEPANAIVFVDAAKMFEGMAGSFEALVAMQRVMLMGEKPGDGGLSEAKAALNLMDSVVKAMKALRAVDAVVSRTVLDGEGYSMTRFISITGKGTDKN